MKREQQCTQGVAAVHPPESCDGRLVSWVTILGGGVTSSDGLLSRIGHWVWSQEEVMRLFWKLVLS